MNACITVHVLSSLLEKACMGSRVPESMLVVRFSKTHVRKEMYRGACIKAHVPRERVEKCALNKRSTHGWRYVFNFRVVIQLQMNMERHNYCYSHNIIFDDDDKFEQHQEDCAGLLFQTNLCTQHADDGSMCGLFFPDTDGLRRHALERHKVYICGVCDAQSIAPLANHPHKKGEKSIHQSECEG